MADHLDRLRAVIDAEVEPNAIHVDASGAFPSGNIDALKAGGLLGLVSAESVGGEGLGPGAATTVVTELARHCSSTASSRHS